MERITNMMTSQATINDLASVYSELASTQQEMSSGKRLTQPSDDPYGASQVVSLNGQLTQLSSYNDSVNDATTWVNTATGALGDIEDSVQRVRELVVEAGNGTMSSSDASSAASEISQLIDQVKTDANASYDGNYIFSGTATQTAPYQAGSVDTYQGNTGTVSRAIGPGTQVQVNSDISGLLGNGSGSGDGKLLDTLRTIVSDLQSGTTASGNALRSTDLQNLDTNLSTLNTMQVNAGTLSSRLTLASSRIQDLQQTTTTALANTQDADLAQTAIQYSTEQAAYTAALKAGATIVQNSLVNFL